MTATELQILERTYRSTSARLQRLQALSPALRQRFAAEIAVCKQVVADTTEQLRAERTQ